MVQVTMCGYLADRAGWRERAVEADTLAVLKVRLAAEQPSLAGLLDGGRIFTVVNDVVTRGDAPIGDADEVAFMPPIGGG